ncbi:Crp/Fnr family transcriptional regulator [Ahrensia sp. R2A130]|uniref:Crp/Fnr family transcriptional regulator n=1 Tax=Ahrensia sp. R2A130 TaxID=744979 RepID=UPI0001E09CA4|nr:Crp/Fnr family transcriptional regulator [Ahrensia sp. R2A130]EFL88187.1 transcriptional activator protein FnrL [Ahrensia sp. R2A130]
MLNPEQLQRLAKHTVKSAHPPKTDLQTKIDPRETYSNVLSGVVKLTKTARDGRQQIVGLQFAPDFMGRPYSDNDDMTATASTNVRLCSFPASVLAELIEETPAIERRMFQQKMAELDEARDWLFALGRKTAPEKVASFLLLIATHAEPERTGNEAFEIDLPLKRAEIADFLGLTIETVSRQMTKLRHAGVIDVRDRNTIHIYRIDDLRQASCVETG